MIRRKPLEGSHEENYMNWFTFQLLNRVLCRGDRKVKRACPRWGKRGQWGTGGHDVHFGKHWASCQCDFSRESSSIYDHWIQNSWQWPSAEFLGTAHILSSRKAPSRFGSSSSSLGVHGPSNVTFSHCAVLLTSYYWLLSVTSLTLICWSVLVCVHGCVWLLDYNSCFLQLSHNSQCPGSPLHGLYCIPA